MMTAHAKQPRRDALPLHMSLAASRNRLVIINVLVVTSILAIMAGAVYASEAHAIDQQMDQQLVQWARHEPTEEIVTEYQAMTKADEGDDIYAPSSPNIFAIALDSTGKVIFDPGQATAVGLPDVAATKSILQGGAASNIVTVQHGAHRYRLFTLPIRTPKGLVGALQVGMSLDARDQQLHDLLWTLALVGAGVLLLTAVASLYLAERALLPTRMAFQRQRQFIAAASHELRTPLAIMRSQLEFVTRRLQRTPSQQTPSPLAELKTDVDEALDEVDYMTRLVGDLLLLARTGTISRVTTAAPLDLVPLVRDAVAKMTSVAAAKQIPLVLSSVDEALRVAGDADRLRQVVLILLDNALRYTAEGGTISVTLQRTTLPHFLHPGQQAAQIIVQDTGIGILPGDLARIFEPFYRAENARAIVTTHEGAGLGLALAQTMVAEHGGAIAVESSPDSGSTFTVTLPLTSWVPSGAASP
jgi:signal transduction histidine kinase